MLADKIAEMNLNAALDQLAALQSAVAGWLEAYPAQRCPPPITTGSASRDCASCRRRRKAESDLRALAGLPRLRVCSKCAREFAHPRETCDSCASPTLEVA